MRIKFGHCRDRRTGRAVPLALFRDLVAHEVTHAILDDYRKRWAEEYATLDELALHEAVANLVAMLSVFSSQDRVEQLLSAQLGAGNQRQLTNRCSVAGNPSSPMDSLPVGRHGPHWMARLALTGAASPAPSG
jgi:hypothetical protein